MNYLPLISIVTNILMVLIGALLARWIGGILQNFESKIRIAILELRRELGGEFATKKDVERVEAQVRLGERVDEGFNQVLHLLRNRRTRQQPAAEAIVR